MKHNFDTRLLGNYVDLSDPIVCFVGVLHLSKLPAFRETCQLSYKRSLRSLGNRLDKEYAEYLNLFSVTSGDEYNMSLSFVEMLGMICLPQMLDVELLGLDWPRPHLRGA